jgi:hypothetical protein
MSDQLLLAEIDAEKHTSGKEKEKSEYLTKQLITYI